MGNDSVKESLQSEGPKIKEAEIIQKQSNDYRSLANMFCSNMFNQTVWESNKGKVNCKFTKKCWVA